MLLVRELSKSPLAQSTLVVLGGLTLSHGVSGQQQLRYGSVRGRESILTDVRLRYGEILVGVSVLLIKMT